MRYNELIFINTDSLYHAYSGQKNMEGGASRNSAWLNRMKSKKHVKIVNIGNGKGHYFRILFTFLFSYHKKIFSLYPSIGIQLYKTGFVRDFLRRVYFAVVSFSSHYNDVVFDISDLKYEQAIDLELTGFDQQVLKRNEELLFSIKRAYFIFASKSMMEYAIGKYGILMDHSDFCNNGGVRLSDAEAGEVYQKREAIRYVYAGTLNRGRNIECMVDLFPESDEYELLLMGTNGEWLKEYTKKRNVRWYGALEEQEAHKLVSTCDIGIIPYRTDRLYNNLAYPTKLSFYITAGIPYLSTPVAEVERENSNINGGWLLPVTEWNSMIQNVKKEEIMIKKANVVKHINEYLWESILDNNKFVN